MSCMEQWAVARCCVSVWLSLGVRRYALVIRSLLTQEGICMTLKPDFHFLEVSEALSVW
jgi:hypothetical protein